MIILRFVYTPSFLTRLIEFDSDDDPEEGFSHVDGVTTKGTYIGAHVPEVAERPSNWDAGKFKRERFLLLPADADMTAKWEHYLRACIGEKYGTVAIFSFITHFNLNKKHTTICSGLQTAALRGCDYFPRPLQVPFHRISVRDLHLILMAQREVREIGSADPEFLAHTSAGK